MTLPIKSENKRIVELDILRAVVLYGILIVHIWQNFGLTPEYVPTGYSKYFYYIVAILLYGKCNITFCFLFGVSFSFILKKRRNNITKFIWRCIILIMIGCFDKFFYWNDVLIVYGLTGIICAPLYKLSNKSLIIIATFVYLIPMTIMSLDSSLNIGNWIYGNFNHTFPPPGCSLKYIMSRSIIKGTNYHLYLILSSTTPFKTITLVILGYVFGRSGCIYTLKQLIRTRYLVTLWLLAIITLWWQYFTHENNFLSSFKAIDYIVGGLTYSYTFLYIYYNSKVLRIMLDKLASYGRCGLTNYSAQAIISVSVYTCFYNYMVNGNFLLLIAYSIILFSFQAIFSFYWLKYMYYGPLEWLWRSATNLQWIPLLKRQKGV